MLNKLKAIFCLVLCAGLFGGLTQTSAQTGVDKILVAGKKPLKQSEVNKIIEFYEWAFEAVFTEEQREQFQSLSIQAFKQDVAASRKNADGLLNVYAQILTKDEATQQKMREIFNADFLKELRQTDDETSQLLLSVYDGAHGGKQSNVSANQKNEVAEDAVDNNAGDEGDSAVSVGSISNLVGKWAWGRSGSTTYTTAGSYVGGNGSRHTYQFFANGTVEYVGIMNIMTGGCRIQIFRTAKGKAKISGDTLTINWSPAGFSRDDSCSPSKNYKKTMPAETEVFQVKMKTEYGQKQLCLTGKNETCFSSTDK